MEYLGRLYGKIGGKYFDTGHTTRSWVKLEKEIEYIKAPTEAELLKVESLFEENERLRDELSLSKELCNTLRLDNKNLREIIK